MAALATLLTLSAGCSSSPENEVQGYVEGDFVRVSLPESGIVTALFVERGDVVKRGDPLYALDSGRKQAAFERALAELDAAESELKNLEASERGEEIRALEDEVRRLRAELNYATREHRRQSSLSLQGAAARNSVERLLSEKLALEAQVRAAESRLALARLSIGRADEIATAQKTLDARRASVREAKEELDLRKANAPAHATVSDVIYRPGETVSAGQAVVELLPPENVKARFYLAPGQVARVNASPDVSLRLVNAEGQSLSRNIPGKVTYVSPEASYRPPVLYSRDQVAKLVFLVEAVPLEDVALFRPGQPVTVILPVQDADGKSGQESSR